MAIARFDGDQLTVYASTQAVFHLKELIAKRFKMDVGKIRVIAEHVGGGFGSKASLGNETIAAIELARAAKAPVRVAFDRHEELTVTGYRPAAEMSIAMLPSTDGALKAVTFDASADTGAAINSTIAGLARLIYPAEAKHLADFDVVSNLPPGAAFRGPGGPPMAFALEQAVDEAAIRLKADPIELRKRWDTDPNRRRLYDWALQLDVWKKAKTRGPQSGRYRYGIGAATGYWLYLWQPKSKVELAIENHRLVVSVAVQDIGQGSRTVLANTVARAFDLEAHEVVVRIGNSALSVGPASGGSRTTASVVPPTLMAIDKLKAEIQGKAARPPAAGSNAPWRDLIASSPDIRVSAVRGEDGKNLAPGVRSPLREAGFMGFVFGLMFRWFSNIAVGAGVPSSVQVIEVEVDTWLGHVKVLKAHTGIAVGKLASPDLARNQAAGSVVQGIGYALYEGREVDAASGNVLTVGLEDYRIPGIADTPLLDVHFDEGGFGHVMGGSVGIGEVATVPTCAALANAIRNATGVQAAGVADPARPPARTLEGEGRSMSASSAARRRIPRRRHRSLRTPPHRRLARHDRRSGRIGRDHRHQSGARTALPASAHRRASPAIAADAQIVRAYPGLAAAAGGLATPQIRHLATVGGNLAQRSRCWYFRNPHFDCFKKGGSDCPSRAGNHLYGVAFDLGPCVAPHPSTLAAALLAYDATVATRQAQQPFDLAIAGRRKECVERSCAAAGRGHQEHPAAAAARGRARVLQARHQPHVCRMAAGRTGRARGGVGRKIRGGLRGSRRHRARAAAPRRRRARRHGRGRDHRHGGRRRKAGDRRRKPAADDRLQARSAAGPRARSAGQVCGVEQRRL